MNVRELALRGFMSHVDTELSFPERGVVVVQGANGAGKSAVVEGVAWALWGRTLRGADPCASEYTCARVELDAHVVKRERRKARTTLMVSEESGTWTHDTTTKMQRALDRRVGAWDVWRRACVFSTSDPSAFTGATDAERKRLLEVMLGLDRFDAAAVLAAKHRRELATELDARRTVRARADGVVAGLRAAQAPAIERSPLEDVESLRALYNDAMQQADALRTNARAASARRDECRRAKSELMGRVYALAKEANAFRDGKCPTCGSVVEKRGGHHGAELSAMRDKCEELERRAHAHHTEEESLNEQAHHARTRAAMTNARIVSVEQEVRRRAEEDAARARVAVDLVQAEETAEEWALLVEQGEVDMAHAVAVEAVLGTKGVRSAILSRTLTGIEAAANGWLARMVGQGLSLRLRSYTEKKTGGTTEALSLDVDGAGGGHGYAGASAGERRRIDVAVMLALADVAAASHGHTGGTLFFDEVFDSLDELGVDAVCRVVHELARTRAVVVITHSKLLVDALRPDAHWRVNAGVVEVVR